MSSQQYTVNNSEISDTSAFTVPGEKPGQNESFQSDQDKSQYRMGVYVHVHNGLDANVDVTLQGSHSYDSAINNPVNDGATETINSGDSGAFDTTVGHAHMQVSVTPNTTPTNGSLTVTFEAREQ